MTLRPLPLLACFMILGSAAFPDRAASQSTLVELAPRTTLAAQIPTHVPLHVGQPIHAELLYPVYAGTQMVLPAKTIVTGAVIALRPDTKKRIRARFNLDFTPYRTPVVRFNEIRLPDGTILHVATDGSADGAPIVRLEARGAHKKENIFHREYDAAVQLVRDDIVFVTAPGRGDRLRQLLYHQLPWHPQRIGAGTAWTVETGEVIRVSVADAAAPTQLSAYPAGAADGTEVIEANLEEPLSSATARVGEEIHAVVAEPAFHPDHTLAMPQGAILLGKVTQDLPSRSFGRAGSLRFGFNEVILPSGQRQSLSANLAGVDAAAELKLNLDAEGEVKQQPQDKVIVPAILLGLASAPLDPDPGDNDEFFKNADASNSLGVIGFVTGIAVNRAGVSAGFGYYGAALSISSRWIQHGEEVTFPRGTRIILQTTGRGKPGT